ncbi:MAG TPA: hypothetical protein PLA80_14075, partial [Synergistaceae bacterium]|nr:hypothetical protein [Synergistaceae bacterium]
LRGSVTGESIRKSSRPEKSFTRRPRAAIQGDGARIPGRGRILNPFSLTLKDLRKKRGLRRIFKRSALYPDFGESYPQS